ncbi:MAG: serine/threonine protein kinase [Deltaproteobacteria bacterium]|nr:serine/threonine protein kinase [Deltaproteobacteria bacterium]
MPSERLLSQTAGRRVLLKMDSAGAVRVVRRIRAESEAGPDLVARATSLGLVKGQDLGCLAKIHEVSITPRELEVTEQFIDGFTISNALDVVQDHISVNVALALVFELAVSLGRLHALKEKDGRPAQLIHGKLGLDRVLITGQGEIKLAGLEGLRGEPAVDVAALVRTMLVLLAKRASNPQGRELLDRLGKLKFVTMGELAKAIQVYLVRQDPQDLLAKRARFTSVVLRALEQRAEHSSSTPVIEGPTYDPFAPLASEPEPEPESEGSTQLAPYPKPPDQDTAETPAQSPLPAAAFRTQEVEIAVEDDLSSPWALALSDVPDLGDDQPPTEVMGAADPLSMIEGDVMEPDDSTVDGVAQAALESKVPPPLPPVEPRSAVVVGNYRVVASIGRGGMGEIYLARSQKESSRGRLVALKVLGQNAGLGGDEDEGLAMLMDEAAIMARIDHPHVLRVVDFGRAEERYFLATEYLQGRPLVRVMIEAYAQGDGLDYSVIAAIGADAAMGLYAAHTATSKEGLPLKVVHRDVSPQNIFVTYGGTSKVIDFGVARAVERVSMTAVGLVKGKAAYMSPEQAEGKEVDAKSDVFSLGVCLWEMAAGRRLFKQEKEYDTLLAVQLQPIEPPTVVRGKPNPVLDHIILSALHRDPGQRTPSAKALAEQLIDYVSNVGVEDRHAHVQVVLHRLFGDAAHRERELIDRLEAAAASPEEIDLLRNLSGVSPRSGIKDYSVLGDSGQMMALDESGFGKAAAFEESTGEQVIKAVQQIQAERSASQVDPASHPPHPAPPEEDPTRRLPSDPKAPVSLEASSIDEEDATFAPIAAGRGPTRVPASPPPLDPIVELDPPPAPRWGWLIAAGVALVAVGTAAAYWWARADHPSGLAKIDPPPGVVAPREVLPPPIPTATTSTTTTVVARLVHRSSGAPDASVAAPEVPDAAVAVAPPPALTPPPPAVAPVAPPPPKVPKKEKVKVEPPAVASDPPIRPKTKGKTGTAEALATVRSWGLGVTELSGTVAIDDKKGGSFTAAEGAKWSRVEGGEADGYVVYSTAPGLTAVGWVGSIRGRPHRARALSINDCPAELRVEASGVAIRYGGEELMMTHGGSTLKDLTLEPPAFADRLELEPLGLSFGKKEEGSAMVHCRTGWWGKRVVLRRLPLGRYTLRWVGEGASQTATLLVTTEPNEGPKTNEEPKPVEPTATSTQP